MQEVFYYRVVGPRSREGLWTYSKNNVYNYFSAPFLEMSTLGLLTSQYQTMDIWLTPSFCPGIDMDESIDNLLPIYELFIDVSFNIYIG